MYQKNRKNGSVVYSFATPHDRKARTLFINMIPKYECTNNCRFCSRKDAIKGKKNIYEKKAGTSLFLAKAPENEEIVHKIVAVRKKPFPGLGGTREIAFVGLGEPLMQFDRVSYAIEALREHGFKGKIRVDTNGNIYASDLRIFARCCEGIPINHAKELKEAGLTDIRISVNATNKADYNALCRPVFRKALIGCGGQVVRHGSESAFENILAFVKECIGENIRTCVSFVVGFDDGEVRTKSAEEYREFAKTLGVKPENVIIRKYVPPIC